MTWMGAMARTRLQRILAMLGCTLLAACQQPVVQAPVNDGRLHVAVAGPMSGQYGMFGQELRQGTEQAVADLNAAGGLLGRQLAVDVLDDQCEPEKATRVARDAAARGVAMVVGHFCSSTSIPASDVYEQANIVQITPASTNPALTERGRRKVFRVVGRDDQQGRFAADYVTDRRLGQRIVVVNDGSGYGSTLADSFSEQLRELGRPATAAISIRQGASGYPRLIQELKDAGADLVYFGGYHIEAARILRDAAGSGLKIRLVGGDALVDNAFWTEAGSAGEGTLMTFAADPRGLPTAQEAVQRFRSRNVEPEGYTLYAYAAVQVWAEAVRRAGKTDAEAVAAQLRDGTYPTVLGTLRFNAKGDLASAPSFVMYRWQGGRYGPVSE